MEHTFLLPTEPEDDLSLDALKATCRRLLREAISDFSRRVLAGEISVGSVQDLEKLIKLDLMLAGDPGQVTAPDRVEVFGFDGLSDEELRKRLEAAVRFFTDRRVSESA